MLRQTRKIWRLLKASRSGERFQALYRFRKRKNRSGYTLSEFLMTLLGCFLMVFGLAIGWLPGPGGFVGIIGLAIVAQQFHWIAKLLDATERFAICCWNKVKSLFVKQENPTT